MMKTNSKRCIFFFLIVFFAVLAVISGQSYTIASSDDHPEPGNSEKLNKNLPDTKSNFLADKHEKNGVTCKECHGTLPPEKKVSTEPCLKCHGSYKEIGTTTKNLVPNPHESHFGEIKCIACHKAHGKSVLYCNECHQFDMQVP